jgi:hypothetical protein
LACLGDQFVLSDWSLFNFYLKLIAGESQLSNSVIFNLFVSVS